jgi:hypothetical protein
MNVKRILCGVVAVAITASVAAPAGATTLVRQSLDELVAANGTVVIGEVLDATSYWNADKSFILTDVRVAVADAVKGSPGSEVTVTLMGGKVGETTTLILGGAQLVPGSAYVLFLNQEDLPGVKGALTVRDHVQGAFDIKIGKGGALRAVSQANGHPLVPDRLGYIDAPGGTNGFPLNAMLQSIRETVRKGGN